jgi:ATP-dependent DNA helicase RecQ
MDPRPQLRRIFGFDDFRPGQAEAVAAALAGRDALVVMPTGSGKSLCYQLPALMREDLTLVVSPLVSLMQDQVQKLEALAPGRVGVVNAQRGSARNAQAMQAAASGELRLLYVAPERFAAPGFAVAVAGMGVGLFVVDEAHCVSQWGHDFRPDYFALADAADAVGARTTMALTATATPAVAEDVVRRLRLRDPVRVTTGFDRPGLTFSVVGCRGALDKQRRLLAALSSPAALPALVYAGTRGATDSLARTLRSELGIAVAAYHAGLDRVQRAEVQRRFMDGELELIVATNAFGMGVDKADVRTVCHASVPQSLEAYYQEAGRAGRDGRPAACILFAEQRDKGLHVFFIQRAAVPDGAFHRVTEKLSWSGLGGRYDVPLEDLRVMIGGGADEDGVRAVIGHLARAGVIAPLPSPPDRAVGQVLTGLGSRGLAIARSSAREAERIRWRQYRSVWGYVEGDKCRRAALLSHFGERTPAESASGERCCDVCSPGVAPPAPVGAARRPGVKPRARPGPAAPAGVDSRRGAQPRARPGPLAAATASGDLDETILEIVRAAQPGVGRTRAVEILRGGRSKVVAQHGYDDLPGYGAYAHVRAEDLLAHVDAMLRNGLLRSTGGRFPKLAPGGAAIRAA